MGRESSRAGCSEQHCTSVKRTQRGEPAAVERMECQMVEEQSPLRGGVRGDAFGAKRP